MISTRKGFVFIHIPKCGGDSISYALRKFTDDRFIETDKVNDKYFDNFKIIHKHFGEYKHYDLRQYIDSFGTEVIANKFLFTCVRNPYDRMVASYLFTKALEGKRRYFSLDEFKQHIREPAMRSMSSYVESKEGLTVDYINLENFNREFRQLCYAMGLKNIRLHHKNKIKQHHHGYYFDRDTYKIMNDRFACDFEKFDYKMIETRPRTCPRT